MKQPVLALLLLVSAGFGQTRERLADYALILEDAPVAQKTQSRSALKSPAALQQLARIRTAQTGVLGELKRRRVPVEGAGQLLANAIFVAATRETAVELQSIPGVAHVVRLPRLHPDLTRALDLVNASTAWSSVGGASNAGAGIKIGIIDSGIDQNHPGFQDASLKPPTGFPKGDTGYTNSKVIVARSYVSYSTVGFLADPNNPAATSRPDDLSPRDRMGHGSAIAMIAAGAPNTSPLGQIQGVAPKAFLGNYKIFGSPGVTDFALYAGFHQAMEDALADGMDIVTLSLSEGDPAYYAPLDTDPSCGGVCDIYAQAVENASANGMVVVASAGNDGNVGSRPQTLTSIHRPGTSPSAITVGATANSHALFQRVMYGNGQTVPALFGDGPQVSSPLSAALRDTGGQACSALPANSLAGAIALVQRGTCSFTDKIVNAQNAGAVGVIIVQTSGQETPYSTLGAQSTGIPAVMVGYSDGQTLKSAAGNSVTLDPVWTESETTPDVVWTSSSRGPSPGTFGTNPTSVIKPELVAPGVNIYTATQKLDPNGDLYNSSGYTAVTGTSHAVPMVAGAVALVKQKYPSLKPSQLKSAVVNTASRNVTDQDGVARVNSAGAGKLNAADAVNVAAVLEPATFAFGAIGAASLPIGKVLTITNVSGAAATFNFTVQARDSASASVVVSPSSKTIQSGQQDTVTVTLQGTRPGAGSYEGFIAVTGAGPTLRVPYQFLIASGVPADAYAIGGGSFVGGTNDKGWELDLRVVDQYGVPVVGTPLSFRAVSGGGTISAGDARSFNLGNAAAIVNLGPSQGDQIFNATVSNLTVEFDGFARRYPVINEIRDAAAFRTGQPVAPGSYVAITGTDLSDATQIESTNELPVALSTVSVSFDGGGLSLPGHPSYVSPGQINAQVPWELEGQSSVQVKVSVGYLPSALYTLPLATYSPGIFEFNDNGHLSSAARDFPNYNVITQNNAVKPGDIVQLFCNGLGPVTNQPASGFASPGPPLAETKTVPAVKVGGKTAELQFYGMTPGAVGLYQINFFVPPGTPAGLQPLVISIGGIDSQASVLPVK